MRGLSPPSFKVGGGARAPSVPPISPPMGWLDYGVPTLKSVLDMVKVVDFATREGKVAIHCHAGLGRTGVLIACYLIYSKRMGGDEAIATVREKRYVLYGERYSVS